MIFAIDPGPKVSGWVAFNPERLSHPIVAAGIHANSIMLSMIRKSVLAVGNADPPPSSWSLIVLEAMESHGRPWGTPAIEACHWGGRFDQHAVDCGYNVRKIKNAAVRVHLCGKGGVGGPAVRKALIKRFGGTREAAVGKAGMAGPLYLLPDGRGDHKWSAFALALTAAETKE